MKKEHESIAARAFADAREALRQNPAEVRAIAVLIDLTKDRKEKLRLARSATVTAPDDYRSWLLVDTALEDDAGNTEEESSRVFGLERAVALAPENPWALQRLARSYAGTGRGAAVVLLAICSAWR